MKPFSFLLPLLGFALASKSLGLFAPWAGKDHYNFGGPFYSLFAKCYLAAEPFRPFALPTFCDVSPEVIYKNHPPGLFYLLASMISLLGEQEWIARTLPLFFSVLNVGLIVLISKEAWKGHAHQKSHVMLTGFLQAIFLGTIYFGTHVDMPGEPGISGMLLSTLFALRRQWWLAGLWACIGGLYSWTGFFSIIPMVVLGFRGTSRDRWQTLVMAGVAFFCGLGIVTYLQGGPEQLLPFLQKNLLNNKYLGGEAATLPRGTRGFSISQFLFQYPLVLIKSYSRMLSPLLCGLFFYGSYRICREPRFRRALPSGVRRALFLLGVPWLITSVVGFQYVMVHIFWFMLAMPWIAMTLSVTIANFILEPIQFEDRKRRWTLFACCLVPLALYPYGVYQYHWLHDAANSVAFIGLGIAFLYGSWNSERRVKIPWVTALLLTALLNVSQTLNYRLEDPIAYQECHDQTLRPADFPARSELATRSLAHRYYCFSK